MVKLSMLYGHPDDPAAFEEYYANTHVTVQEVVRNHTSRRRGQWS